MDDAGTGWQGSLSVNWSSQGHGASSSDLSFNASYLFGESGSSLGLGITSGDDKVEGVREGQGGLSLSGLWGLGDVSPSLTLSTSHAAGGMNTRSLDLGLDWVFKDPFSLSLAGGYGTQVHIAPASLLLNLPSNPITDLEAELLSHSLSAGLVLGWQALDRLGLSAGFSRSWDVTDEVRTRSHRHSKGIHQKGWTNQWSLGLSGSLGNHWGWGLNGSYGRQYSPGIGFYNPRSGSTDFTDQPSTTKFFSLATSFSYSFGM